MHKVTSIKFHGNTYFPVHADGQTDMTKEIGAFPYFVNTLQDRLISVSVCIANITRKMFSERKRSDRESLLKY